MFNYVPVRRRYALSDAFFESGDSLYNANSNKTSTYDDDNEEFLHRLLPTFCCHITGCTATFTSVQQYEIHYNTLHRHVCGNCKKLFPTNHLLEVHMLEFHDSLFQLLAEKQNMFHCFVEGCTSKFRDATERKSHLIEFHHYPHNFRFGKLKTKTSLKSNSEVANAEDITMKTTETDQISVKCASKSLRNNSEDANAEDITMKAMDTDKISIRYAPKIPKHICFGQGSSRGFMPRARGSQTKRQAKVKPWHQVKDAAMDTSVSIEEVNMKDLCDALPPS